MVILVTGGAGYIGSHIVNQLINDFEVIVVDDLSSGSKEAINDKATFYNCDICNYDDLFDVFKNNKIDGVIHLAAKLSVEESSYLPLEYFNTNVSGTINLLKCMKENECNNFVFSSTASVYGNSHSDKKVDENAITNPINNYGLSKLFSEKIIQEAYKAHGINNVIFRYFNVAGSKKVGYPLEKNTLLIPKIIVSLKSNELLKVFGDDYDTKDGTCIRDYIHVEDIASAHVIAIKKLLDNQNVTGIYNLGSSNGFSVLDVIKTTEKVLNTKVNYVVENRRVGDPQYLVASSKKANDVLGWKPNINKLDDIILDMWNKNK